MKVAKNCLSKSHISWGVGGVGGPATDRQLDGQMTSQSDLQSRSLQRQGASKKAKSAEFVLIETRKTHLKRTHQNTRAKHLQEDLCSWIFQLCFVLRMIFEWPTLRKSIRNKFFFWQCPKFCTPCMPRCILPHTFTPRSKLKTSKPWMTAWRPKAPLFLYDFLKISQQNSQATSVGTFPCWACLEDAPNDDLLVNYLAVSRDYAQKGAVYKAAISYRAWPARGRNTARKPWDNRKLYVHVQSTHPGFRSLEHITELTGSALGLKTPHFWWLLLRDVRLWGEHPHAGKNCCEKALLGRR